MSDRPTRQSGWLAWDEDVDASAITQLQALGLPRHGEDVAGPGVALIGADLDGAPERLRRWSREGRERVLVIVRPGALRDATHAWRLLDAGACDVIGWSPATLAETRARLFRWAAVDALASSELVRNTLVGESNAWRDVVRQLVEVARFTPSSLLVNGETGTGKELAARLIHALDPREDKRDLVVLDCSTIVPELSGSEFFGHERGAFTGAVAARDGAFELARGGTLFLDEVGELPPPLQTQLLRVIQERTFKRVGGNNWYHADFRLVCATNRDLLLEVAAGRFRSDLYHRIAAWVCRLPPLRERRSDILPLARHFYAAARGDGNELRLDAPVRELLLARDYPGNVRELRQVITRMAERHVGDGPITVGDVLPIDRPAGTKTACPMVAFEDAARAALCGGAGLKDIGRDATDAAIRIVLADEEGNLQRAAARLGVTDRALQLRRRGGSGA
jgi:transcriptional regulator with GAF, ATPase, and Fis domain